MLTCPVCRSRSIRRSARRNIVERLWSLGGRYPYRCYDCQTRFYAYRVPHHEKDKTAEGQGNTRNNRVEDRAEED